MATDITILMVDDDKDDHIFFREALDNLKVGQISVLSVYDGSEAMNFLLKKGEYSKNNSPLPDFIVLDLNMPVLDGWGVMEQLKSLAQFHHLPIYVLTTSWQEAHQTECKRLGCSGFFSKPPDHNDLKAVIQSMLDDAAERQQMIS